MIPPPVNNPSLHASTAALAIPGVCFAVSSESVLEWLPTSFVARLSKEKEEICSSLRRARHPLDCSLRLAGPDERGARGAE